MQHPATADMLFEHLDWMRRLAHDLARDPDLGEDVAQSAWVPSFLWEGKSSTAESRVAQHTKASIATTTTVLAEIIVLVSGDPIPLWLPFRTRRACLVC